MWLNERQKLNIDHMSKIPKRHYTRLNSTTFYIIVRKCYFHYWGGRIICSVHHNTHSNKYFIRLRNASKATLKNMSLYTGLILCLRPANERRRYFVTTSLTGWVQAENQPWYILQIPKLLQHLVQARQNKSCSWEMQYYGQLHAGTYVTTLMLYRPGINMMQHRRLPEAAISECLLFKSRS